jgi:hypothetical protein
VPRIRTRCHRPGIIHQELTTFNRSEPSSVMPRYPVGASLPAWATARPLEKADGPPQYWHARTPTTCNSCSPSCPAADRPAAGHPPATTPFPGPRPARSSRARPRDDAAIRYRSHWDGQA